MKARYQYRFYPTDQQQMSLAQLFGCVRVVWNDALAICKQADKLSQRNWAGDPTSGLGGPPMSDWRCQDTTSFQLY
jgi:transposase